MSVKKQDRRKEKWLQRLTFHISNESYIDMSGYSRESRGNLIKEYYKKKPKIMEYIIYIMFSQTRKRSKMNW